MCVVYDALFMLCCLYCVVYVVLFMMCCLCRVVYVVPFMLCHLLGWSKRAELFWLKMRGQLPTSGVRKPG